MERKEIDEGGVIDYDSVFLPKQEADTLLECLKQSVIWEQKFYNYGSKQVAQPRLTAWYADDPGMKYSYSGVTQTVLPWLSELLELKKKITAVSAASTIVCSSISTETVAIRLVCMLTMKKNWAKIPTSLLSR